VLTWNRNFTRSMEVLSRVLWIYIKLYIFRKENKIIMLCKYTFNYLNLIKFILYTAAQKFGDSEIFF